MQWPSPRDVRPVTGHQAGRGPLCALSHRASTWGIMPLLARYYRTVYPLRLHRIDMRRRLSDYCTNPLSDPQVDGRRSLHDLKATKDRINERVAHFDVGRARSRAPIAQRTTVWKKLDRLLACFSARLDADWQTRFYPSLGAVRTGIKVAGPTEVLA